MCPCWAVHGQLVTGAGAVKGPRQPQAQGSVSPLSIPRAARQGWDEQMPVAQQEPPTSLTPFPREALPRATWQGARAGVSYILPPKILFGAVKPEGE